MKKIIYILVTLVAFACANKEKKAADGGWDITVSGKVKAPQEAQIHFEELTSNDNPKTDSTTTDAQGNYSRIIHLTEPGIYRVNFYNTQMIDVVLDHSDVTINVDGNDASGNYEIIGSPDYDLIHEVQAKLQKFQQDPKIKDMEEQFNIAARNKDEKRVIELQEQYMALRSVAYDEIIKDIENKPVGLGLLNLLQGNTFEKDRYFPFYKKTAEEAIAKWPNSVHVKSFNEMVRKMAVTAIGQKAPEISLPDPEGNMVALSSLKGKYVLVDFWAYWCRPCRNENPNVVKAYHQFKDKGFEVFGVSLDRSKDDWLSAIKEDGLTWTQVSDLKYFESQAALDYNIDHIPFSVLLDPDGVIIAKDLRGGALQKKLDEVFNKKKS